MSLQTTFIVAQDASQRSFFVRANRITHSLELVVFSRERLAKVGGLRADKEVVLVQDLVPRQFSVVVGVGFADQVPRLRITGIEVLGNNPRPHLAGMHFTEEMGLKGRSKMDVAKGAKYYE